MKKRLLIIASITLVVLFLVFYLWVPSFAPPNQKPLTALTSANAGAFDAAFDADANLPRLVLVLSPT